MLKSAKEPGWGALIGIGLLGAFVSGEANAYAAKDHTPFLGTKDGTINFIPAIIPGILDSETRTRYALAGVIGAGLLNSQKLGKLHGTAITGAESYLAGALGNMSNYYATSTDKIKNPDKYKNVNTQPDINVNTETTSDKVFNYGSVLLGLAGLGLGGYAL